MQLAEQLLTDLETGDPESFAGSRQITALAAMTHALIASGLQAGVSVTVVRDATPPVCLTCGFSEGSHTADSGPQGTGCDGSGPWAPAGTPAAMAAQAKAGQ